MSSNGPDRRRFLAGAGAAAVAGLTASCTGAESETADPVDPDIGTDPGGSDGSGGSEVTQQAVAFAGTHQAGIVEPPRPAGLVAAFDATAGSRAELAAAITALSDEVEQMMAGRAPEPAEGFLPPVDSGAIDDPAMLRGTAVTLAVGASLFDDRFGLADRRPSDLIAMPRFHNDGLVRPELSDGDLALLITGPTSQAVTYALHQAVRVTDRRLRLRWVQEGYNDLVEPSPGRIAPTRNLMGFRDGTSNLDTDDADQMEEHVWVGSGDGEPDWAVGGSYLAVRTIRMLIEFWATAALVRQEQIFGRHRGSGAPLGQSQEGDEPTFATDPGDESVPRRSHIRLANPRTPGAARILRRGFSYLNGVDTNSGTLDQGLLFLAFGRTLRRGFLEVQSRLEGEPLEDYIKPVGGGLFFALPGPGTARLGDTLLAQ